jgi:hypothetical protein
MKSFHPKSQSKTRLQPARANTFSAKPSFADRRSRIQTLSSRTTSASIALSDASKIICHYICCLIQETHELGIEIAFREAA